MSTDLPPLPPASSRARTYHFHSFDACNMCGHPASQNRVLGRRMDRRQGWNPRGRPGLSTTVMRCTGCGLNYVDPLPVPDTLGQHYDVPPEEYWSAEQLVVDPDYLHDLLQHYRELSGRNPASGGLRALDIGAGIGKAMRALERAGFEAWGVEPSAPFHRYAIEHLGADPQRLQLASAEGARFPAGHFHFINCGAVLEHIVDPAALLERCVKWLVPGGLMQIEVPSSHYLMSTFMRVFYRLTGTDYVINTCPMHPPYHLYEFTPACFERHGARHGYRVRFFEYFPCTAYLPQPLEAAMLRMMAATRTGMQLSVWLESTRSSSS